MIERKYPEGADYISGFGGGYEKCCQDMVLAGLAWLDENPDAKPEFTQFQNIYGLTADENEDMKKLQKAMLTVDSGATGAMMQASTNHVLAARELGWEEYLKQLEVYHGSGNGDEEHEDSNDEKTES